MKRIAFIFALMLLCMAASSRTIEHNLYFGFGAAKSVDRFDSPCALHVGYGANIYFSNNWSVMPGIAFRTKFDTGNDAVAKGASDCSFIDVPIVAQYHFSGADRNGFVAELGPVFSFITSNQTVAIMDENYKEGTAGMFKHFDLGLQPGIYYQLGRHWRLGVQAHLGLLNISKQIQDIKQDSYHFNDVVATINFHF